MHSALVSISGTPDEMFIHIQLINSFIKKIFGVEHIRFCNLNGEIKLQETTHVFAYQIAQLISSKFDEELQNRNTNNLQAV
jgi:hypothetical protein